MNLKLVPPAVFMLFSACLFGQRVEYSYDDNGNRTGRTLIVEQLQSQSINFPVVNPRALKTVENSKTKETENKTKEAVEEIKPESGEIKANVYPNPNRGIINIDISNMPLNSKNELRIYDLNGNQLIIKKDFERSSQVDLSKYKDGIYILRMRINESFFDWKIIKESH